MDEFNLLQRLLESALGGIKDVGVAVISQPIDTSMGFSLAILLVLLVSFVFRLARKVSPPGSMYVIIFLLVFVTWIFAAIGLYVGGTGFFSGAASLSASVGIALALMMLGMSLFGTRTSKPAGK